MTAHSLCVGKDIAGLTSAHHNQLAVTLKQGGVIVYDTRTQSAVKTWALSPDQQCSGCPAYDPTSQRFFAAVHPTIEDGSPSACTLLTWPRKAAAGSLKQAAQAAQLPAAVHSLHVLHAARHAVPMDLDAAASEQQPVVFAVFVTGAVAACSPSGVVSESVEARGLQPLAACATAGGELVVVHSDPRTGGCASCCSYHLQGSKVQCGPLTQLVPPDSDSRALAAAAAPIGRIAVLWSSGALAVYINGGNSGGGSGRSSGGSQLQPHLCRRLRGFALQQAGAVAAAAAAATPQNGKLGKGAKKRAHGSGSGSGNGSGSAGPVSMAALGQGLLAVAGWSTEAKGATAVRLVVLDSLYGCVQAAVDLTASDVGAPQLDPLQPVQAVGLGSEGQVAVAAGGCALLADLQLRPPTLANLLGALSLGSGAAAGPSSQASRDGILASGSERDSSNPYAAAAVAALHESELAQLLGPGGSAGAGASSAAPAPVEFSLEVLEGAPGAGGGAGAGAPQQLVAAAIVRWREPAAEAMQLAERSAWGALLEQPPATGGGGGGRKQQQSKMAGGLLQAARQLLGASQRHGVSISQRLLARLLLAATGRRQWECVSELLAAQHPGSLAACPGLALALAEAHQYPLLQLLLSQASDMGADEVAATLKCMLRKPSEEAKQAQHAYAGAARAAAEAAVTAAEAASASGAGAPEPLLAVAACAAGAVEGFSAAQVCLHPLVAAQHDSGLLLGALRQLGASDALALLHYLRGLLRNHASLVGGRYAEALGAGGLPAATVLPPPQAALEWAGAAMDANMARLVLQREAAPVLADMRSLVEGQLRILHTLSGVRGMLQHVQPGTGAAGALPTPQASVLAKYRLEWLDLRVR